MKSIYTDSKENEIKIRTFLKRHNIKSHASGCYEGVYFSVDCTDQQAADLDTYLETGVDPAAVDVSLDVLGKTMAKITYDFKKEAKNDCAYQKLLLMTDLLSQLGIKVTVDWDSNFELVAVFLNGRKYDLEV